MLSEGTSGPHPCWGPSNRSDGRGNSTPGVEDKQFSCRRLAGLGAGRGCRTRSLTIRGGRRKADRVRGGTSPSPCRLSLHVGPQCSALPRPRPHAPVGDPEDIPALGLSLPPPRPPLPCCPGRGRRSPFAPERLPAGRSQKVGRAVGDPQSGAWQHLLLCGQCVPGTSACSPEPATPQAPSEGPGTAHESRAPHHQPACCFSRPMSPGPLPATHGAPPLPVSALPAPGSSRPSAGRWLPGPSHSSRVCPCPLLPGPALAPG